jgi:hypothetical protein
MSNTTTPEIHPPQAVRRAARTRPRFGLFAGVVAGPLFLVTASIQGSAREGFDITRHPFSALSVGDFGWVQIVNFVVTGLLVIAAAVGLRHVLPETRRVARGTALVAGLGAGLVAAGIFVTDAADGFPVGTPSGLPDHFSWHAIVHGIVTPLAFVAALSASLVLAVPLGSQYGRRWLLASRTMPATVVLVLVVPGLSGFSLRLALATALVLGWLTAVSLQALIDQRVLVDSISRSQLDGAAAVDVRIETAS